jgi:excisionase family DNA binding protein
MDRDLLQRYLGHDLSLERIGALVDRHPSTVAYWIKKHGLIANGRSKYAPRGSLTREQLQSLVDRDLTLREIAEQLDRSIPTVRYWLSKHGVRRKARRGRRSRVPREQVDAAIRDGARTLMAQCRHHGYTVFVIENSGRVRCRICRMERVSEWRRRVKRRLTEEAGGRCQLCGYHRCPAALEFHHLDRAQKSFGLSLRGVTRSFKQVRDEAAKCALLCANCHAEVEAGYSTI